MSKIAQSITEKSGLPPGALVHIGKHRSAKPRLTVLDYTVNNHSETTCEAVEKCYPYRDSESVSWLNLDGLSDTNLIAQIGEHFGLHPLLLEDVLNTNHRPKVEEFEDYTFLTLKMLGISPDGKSFISEQVSFVLGANWVISFQEQEGDVFDGLRKRIEEDKGNIRKLGADYLFYRLIDTIVDNYFFVTEFFSEQTELLEEKVLDESVQEDVHQIQRLKKKLIWFKKAVTPLREAVSSLYRDETKLITPETQRYLRDVYEHIIQVLDSVETQRDMVSNIMDLHMSQMSNRMNQVMKVLTIIATIFIPLTFIAGIYGMNFDKMPELHWEYGYLTVWVVMLVILVLMILFFRRKRWL